MSNSNGIGQTTRTVSRWSNPDPARFKSACWEGMRSRLTVGQFQQYGTSSQGVEGYPRGYRGNLTLLTAWVPGTYFPASPTLGASTECLLPPASASSPTGWQGGSRLTIDQQVDLTTGLPLVKITDLELPLGAATFRLNRTRSALHGHSFPNVGSEVAKWSPEATDQLWDWTGSGWMISENPVLLIDDLRPDFVSAESTSGSLPTCWLILDAHHAIPFQWVPDLKRYEAPPRFRARLTYTTTLNLSGQTETGKPSDVPQPPVARHWDIPPVEYKVSLYDGALTYTFAAIYEDIPPNTWDPNLLYPPGNGQQPQPIVATTLHDRPILPDAFRRDPATNTYYQDSTAASVAGVGENRYSHHPYDPLINPGLGIPYMGLCTRIEDRFGHSVEINYCRTTQTTIDSGRGTDCVECAQSCLKKGQISHITLKEGNTVRWTLLYSHRHFPGANVERDVDFTDAFNDYFNGVGTFPLDADYWANPTRFESHGHSAIDRIYVYQGDLFQGGWASVYPAGICLTTPSTVPSKLGGIGENSAVSEPVNRFIASHGVPSEAAQRLTQWRYRVRYDYNQTAPIPLEQLNAWSTGGQQIDPVSPALDPRPDLPTGPPLLVMTTVDHKEAQQTQSTRVNARVFVYGGHFGIPPGDSTMDPHAPYVHPFVSDGGVLYGQNHSGLSAHLKTLPWLAAIFESADIARVLAPSASTQQPTVSLEELAYQRKGSNLLDNDRRKHILGNASVRFDPAPEVMEDANAQRWRTPSLNSLFETTSTYGQYITCGVELTKFDSHWATVGEYTRKEGAAEKAYRFHRFIRYTDVEQFEVNGPAYFHSLRENHNRHAASPPTPSVFLSPFYWHAGQGVAETQYARAALCVQPPVLTSPRFIVVADEFSTRDAMMAVNEDYDTASGGARKKGLTARTVYEINAWGYLLKSRRWEYKSDSATISMKGIGQEMHYKAIGDVIAPGTGWRSNNTHSGITLTTGIPNESVSPPSAFLHELVLTEKRSIGWSAAENQAQHNGNQQGLVEFFEYQFNANPALTVHAYPWSARLHQTASGIRKGTAGDRFYTHQTFYDPSRPGSPVCTVRFNAPRTQPLPAAPTPPTGSTTPDPAFAATFHIRQHYTDGSSTPQFGQPLLMTAQIDPPLRQRPGGPLYYPIQRTLYTPEGLPHWQIAGLVKDPDAPGDDGDPLQRLMLSYTSFGAFGAVAYTVADTIPGAPVNDPSSPGGTLSIPDWPTGISLPQPPRIAPAPPLAYATVNWYDFKGVLTDTFTPDKRWAMRWVMHDDNLEAEGDETVEEFTFDHLPLPASGQQPNSGPYLTQSPGTRRLLKGRDRSGPIIESQTVYYPSTVMLHMSGRAGPTAAVNLPAWEAIKRINYVLDSFGRPKGAGTLERMTTSTGQTIWVAAGGKEINDLGEVYRQWDYGGNVTRWTRNHLGHRLRKYAGSIDTYWGNPGYDTSMQGGVNEFNSRYDMVLKERTDFGTTPHDIWQHVAQRRYVRNPAWAHADYYGPPPSNDPDAYVSTLAYDWRGRMVRTDDHDLGDPTATSNPPARLRTTLRYLDYAGRERLTVEFGTLMPATLAAGLDPVTLGTLDTLPDPRAFQQVSPRPVSVVQKLYDDGDRVIEERTYDMSAPLDAGGAQPPYTAHRTLYGQGGTAVFTQSTNGSCEVVTLDGLGRVASKAQVAYGLSSNPLGYELTRTDLTMDTLGRVLAEVSWERVRPTGDALNQSNAVPSIRWTWYDTLGRKTAEADIGTGQIGVQGWTEFRPPTSGESPPSRPATGPSLDDTTLMLDRAGLPPHARVSAWAYNRANQATASIAPDGRATTYTYQGDKVLTQTDNANAPVADRRTTRSTYANGRLVARGVEGTLGKLSPDYESHTARSSCRYGAWVVDHEFVPCTYDRTLIGAMGRDSNDKSPFTDGAEFVYQYTFQGQLAARTAADGVVTRYRYDAFGRLASIEIGHATVTPASAFIVGYPPSPLEIAGDRIGYVEFNSTWAAVNGVPQETRDTIARVARLDPQNPANPGRVISHVRQRFDGRGRLIREWQSHGGPVDNQTPSIQYAWSQGYATTDNPGWSRLDSMLYPSLAGLDNRTVSLGYGTPGSLDDHLSRLTSITSQVPSHPAVPLAAYTFSGGSRRTSTTLGVSGVVQTLDGDPASVGLTGLDGFGQVRDHTYRSVGGSGTILYGAQYAYDPSGRVMGVSVSHVPVSSQPQVNTRSWVYGYDGLGRLGSADLGAAQAAWSQGLSTWSVPAAGLLRADRWHLDVLDNWSANHPTLPGAGGRVTSGNLDWHGTPFAHPGSGPSTDSLVASYATTDRSDLSEVSRASNGASPQSVTILRDACGRIICDGLFYYHYDAWGRLVQVNQAKVQGEGEQTEWVSGSVIRHMVYDGLGRLIRSQAPVVAPNLHPDVQPVELLGPMRSEAFYYDGVRRIAEVVIDPVDPKAVALISEDLQEQQAAQQTGGESGGGGGSGGGAGGETANVSYEKVIGAPTRLTREYVWGPGDGHAGIDELLCQFDGENRQTPWWAVQDLSGDVVALIYKATTTAPAMVAWQCTYEPYGGVLAERTHIAHPPLRLGHKGLFADNLDAQGFTALVPDERPVLKAGLPLHYHVRNRSLLAGELTDEDGNPRTWAGGMGRFLQPDPNGTGVGVMFLPAWHGEALLSVSPVAELTLFTGDAVHALAYCGSEPLNLGDPMGLFIPMGPTTTMDLWSDHAQTTLQAGIDVRSHIMDMFGEYNLNSVMDYGWAMDWSQPDDLYAGSANERMGTGSWAPATGNSDLYSSNPLVSASGWNDPGKTERLTRPMRPDAKGLGVYIVLDGDNNVIYAGRSKDLANRMKQQEAALSAITGKPVRVIGREIKGRNARATVRALEQMLISTYDLIENGQNQINGISPKNKKIQQYLRALSKFR